MTFKKCFLGMSGLAALTMLAGDTQSAPIAGAAKDVGQAAVTDGYVAKAQYRYRQAGPRVYGYQAYGPRAYGYQPPMVGYGAYPLVGYGYLPAGDGFVENYTDAYVSPDLYWTGSRPWWELMDKLGRGGHQD